MFSPESLKIRPQSMISSWKAAAERLIYLRKFSILCSFFSIEQMVDEEIEKKNEEEMNKKIKLDLIFLSIAILRILSQSSFSPSYDILRQEHKNLTSKPHEKELRILNAESTSLISPQPINFLFCFFFFFLFFFTYFSLLHTTITKKKTFLISILCMNVQQTIDRIASMIVQLCNVRQ